MASVNRLPIYAPFNGKFDVSKQLMKSLKLPLMKYSYMEICERIKNYMKSNNLYVKGDYFNVRLDLTLQKLFVTNRDSISYHELHECILDHIMVPRCYFD